jgi:hypothetical protein
VQDSDAPGEDSPPITMADLPLVLFWGWAVGPLLLGGGLYWVAGSGSVLRLALGAVVACAGFLFVLMPFTAFAALRRARRRSGEEDGRGS